MSRRGATLELAVLGLLHDAPMHGYELRKQLTGLLGWGRVLSYGTLYPCLKALTAHGLIASDTDGAAARKRNRIVYRLTADGKERFTELVAESGPTSWEDGSFDIRFAFFSRTDVRTRVRILEGRRSRLEERVDNVKASLQRSRERMDEYTLALQQHGLESAEREVRWLTELIDAERTNTARSKGTPPRPGADDSTPDR